MGIREGQWSQYADKAFNWRYDPNEDILRIHAFGAFEVDGIHYLSSEEQHYGVYLRQPFDLISVLDGGDTFWWNGNDDYFAEEIADIYIKTGYIMTTRYERWERNNNGPSELRIYHAKSLAEAWEHNHRRFVGDTFERWLKDMSSDNSDDEWDELLERLSEQGG